jgi:hypothetical protein
MKYSTTCKIANAVIEYSKKMWIKWHGVGLTRLLTNKTYAIRMRG